ncbi:MAG: hypothetical protein IT353_15865 [Gemmatimonadaceae bacterium]|nr:hypothetical protein [Gemmatimonadaceae bacterium]
MLTTSLVSLILSATTPYQISTATHVEVEARQAVVQPVMQPPARTAESHLDSAKRAMTNGAFDVARREFAASAALTRQAGKLPLEAVLGLANALYAQSYDREAATTLEQLAAEAALRGDNDAEAIALADAYWLNTNNGQRLTARKQRDRLRALVKDTPLSQEAQRAIRSRAG